MSNSFTSALRHNPHPHVLSVHRTGSLSALEQRDGKWPPHDPRPLKSLLLRLRYFHISHIFVKSERKQRTEHQERGWKFPCGWKNKNAADSLRRTTANIFVSFGVNRMRLGAVPPLSVGAGTSQILGEAVAFKTALFTVSSCVFLGPGD